MATPDHADSLGDDSPEEPSDDKPEGDGAGALVERPPARPGPVARAGRHGAPPAISEMFAAMAQMGPPPNPLQEKITAEHISEMLAADRDQIRNVREDRKDARQSHFRLAVLACVFVLALVVALAFLQQGALIPSVLTSLIAVVAGAFGGYGVAKGSRD